MKRKKKFYCDIAKSVQDGRVLTANGFLQVAAVALFLAICSGCHSSGGPAKYQTVTVSRGKIVQHVTASGSLSALVSVNVGSQVSGKVSALYADFNSPVKKGQLVAEIDPTIYEATLRQAEGDLASAKADVTLKRQKTWSDRRYLLHCGRHRSWIWIRLPPNWHKLRLRLRSSKL